jgi:putative transposase
VIGVAEGGKEDTASWKDFLRDLKKRGLTGIKLVISDKCLGLVEAVTEVFPESKWQWCIVHFYRAIFKRVPRHRMREVAAMLKAIHEQEDRAEAERKAAQVADKLEQMHLGEVANLVRQGVADTLTYFDFPSEHRIKIRTNNPLERVIREIRRRTRIVCAFPDGKSALMLAAARLRHMAGGKWGLHRYMRIELLYEREEEGVGPLYRSACVTQRIIRPDNRSARSVPCKAF